MQGNPKVNIAVAQMDCVVGETTPNLNKIRHFAGLAANLGADIAIFPECCTTGYFIGDKLSTLAEPEDGATAKELGDIASSSKLHLAVGMFTKDGNAVRNSQLLFAPDGKRLATYHKAHLFASEREFCRPGDQPVVADTKLGKIGMTICYDLIFPEYLRRPIEMGAVSSSTAPTGFTTDISATSGDSTASPSGGWCLRGRSRTASSSRWRIESATRSRRRASSSTASVTPASPRPPAKSWQRWGQVKASRWRSSTSPMPISTAGSALPPTGAIAGPNSIADALIAAGGGNGRC
jgi:predicted amidohydrolase